MGDPFNLASDPELLETTLWAGWRYYLRKAGSEEAPQALAEWVDAMRAVLDLGVKPSKYFQGPLLQVLRAVPEGVLLGIGRPENFPGFTPCPQDAWATPESIREEFRRLRAADMPVVTLHPFVLNEINWVDDDPGCVATVCSDGGVVRLTERFSPDWLAHFKLGDIVERYYPFEPPPASRDLRQKVQALLAEVTGRWFAITHEGSTEYFYATSEKEARDSWRDLWGGDAHTERVCISTVREIDEKDIPEDGNRDGVGE